MTVGVGDGVNAPVDVGVGLGVLVGVLVDVDESLGFELDAVPHEARSSDPTTKRNRTTRLGMTLLLGLLGCHRDLEREPDALFCLHSSNAPVSYPQLLTTGEDVQVMHFEGGRLLSNHRRRLEEIKEVGDLAV